MTMLRTHGLGLALTAALGLAGRPALALTTDDIYYQTIHRDEAMPSVDLGEQLPLSSRILGFRQTDIDLRGVGSIPVQLVREYATGGKYRPFSISTGSFADWVLVLPSIWGVVTASNKWFDNRCTQFAAPEGGYPSPTGEFVDPEAFFHGWHLETLEGSEILLQGTGLPNAHALTSKYWTLTCLPGIDNGTGEGFVAHSPDGLAYTFNHLVYQSGGALTVQGGIAGAAASGDSTVAASPTPTTTVTPQLVPGGSLLTLRLARMLVTRIDDRFGNWVQYGYDTSNQLQSIVASDGRRIDFTWSNGRIVSAKPNNDTAKSWQYGYATVNGYPTLVTVTRPDGRQWTFDLASFSTTAPTAGTLGFGSTIFSAQVTAPDGMTASYSAKGQWQQYDSYLGSGSLCGYQSLSVYSKTYAGPATGSLTWSYTQTDPGPITNGPACASEKWVQVRAPDGTALRQTFSTHRADWQEGMLRREDFYPAGSTTAVRSIVYDYVQRPCPGTFLDHTVSANSYTECDPQRRTLRTITQSGDTYTTQYQAWDNYNHLTQWLESNSLASATRTTQRSYVNDAAQWILGLPDTESIDGTGTRNVDYNSLDLPSADYQFGLKQADYTYLANGELATAKDALHPAWTFSDYYRGLPRHIDRPDGSATTATVNPDGTIATLTDPRGSTSGYSYDSVRRLTSVTYPSPDTVAWTNKSLAYTYLTAAELGMPAGSLRVRSTQGRHRISTYYDALLRPILVEDKDTTTGKTVYTRKAYDYEGRETFASYPSDSDAATAGITSTYDALGRLTQRQTTDGVTLEQIAYLSGNRKQITDADGKVTTITYQAFGEPEYERPTLIESPENQTTTIARDVFGKITSVTQSGSWSGGSVSATRSFTYDSHQRPCRRIDPESGSTIWGYDAASQVVWELKGTSGTGCVTTQPSGATVFGYDALGRKTLDDAPGTADDVSYGYDAAGNLTSVSNPTATWTYTYNKRNLLETEQAVIDGKTFVLNPTYNALAQISQLATPGQTIAYAPDAFGRPTQLGSYASGITYHPNGLPQSYTLGNGLTYSQSLDTRQRPDVQSTLDGSTTIQRYQYSYSNAGDLLSLDDDDDADSVTLTYDNLHRLKTATGLWGSYGYVYDPLNNLRTRTGPNALTYSYNATTNRLSGISGSQTRSYGYNARGEITGDGTKTFTLNAKGQISSITGIASYGYDGNGKRIKTVKGSNTEYALYDQAGHLVYTEQGTTKTDYLTLSGQTIVELKKVGSTTTPTYLHPDLLGSPRKATDAAGTILWDEHYDPYGQKLNGVAEKIGYTSHAFDPESNLTYMQARFFDPLIGGFLSIDPVGFKDDDPFSFGRYAYANRNPYRFTDPSGMCVSQAPGDGCSRAGPYALDAGGGKEDAGNPFNVSAQSMGYVGEVVVTPRGGDGAGAGISEEPLDNLGWDTLPTPAIAEKWAVGIIGMVGSKIVGKIAAKGIASLPMKPSQLGHIFRNAPGHLADTPANRQLLTDVASNSANRIGVDRFGNVWSTLTRSDGTQVWVSTRNGVIQNGGLNQVPQTFPDIVGP